MIKKKLKKKAAASNPKTQDTTQKMQILMSGLSEMYPLDHQAPGLVLSYLKTKKLWYASVARYEGRDGVKEVLAAATAPTLDGTVSNLIATWRSANRNSSRLAEVSLREESARRTADKMLPARKRSYAKRQEHDSDFCDPDSDFNET